MIYIYIWLSHEYSLNFTHAHTRRYIYIYYISELGNHPTKQLLIPSVASDTRWRETRLEIAEGCRSVGNPAVPHQIWDLRAWSLPPPKKKNRNNSILVSGQILKWQDSLFAELGYIYISFVIPIIHARNSVHHDHTLPVWDVWKEDPSLLGWTLGVRHLSMAVRFPLEPSERWVFDVLWITN